MILQEKHKEFAVNCFARFMSTSQTVAEFKEEFHEELPKPHPIQPNQDTDEYHYQVEQHNKIIKEKLYHQLRRYDITHRDFPQKYRELFNQFRREYITIYLLEDIASQDSICNELQALYGFVRQQIFQSMNSNLTTYNIITAKSLLETIAKYLPEK